MDIISERNKFNSMVKINCTKEEYQSYLEHSVELVCDKGMLESNRVYIKALAGDASARRYFRIKPKDSRHHSMIMMLAKEFDPAKNNFLLIGEILHKSKVPVPEVFATLPNSGAILLNDLGDYTMLHALEESMSADLEEKLFCGAVELLEKIHQNVKRDLKSSVEAFHLEFDQEKLMWEVEYTLQHLFENYLRRSIPAKELKQIKEAFSDICERLAKEPKVFCHRDYHTRNLMVSTSNSLTAIDFQDARMGLRQYDLASILRDSYYQLGEDLIYRMVDYYIDLMEKRGSQKVDRAHFVQIFDLMSIQRNFKAIGSFASFYARHNNALYLRFIGNTFENIRRNLNKFPEYKQMQKNLFTWYYF